MLPQSNQIYRHFKGNLYRIITVAVHTETEEELVIYQALYGDFKVYARPLSMFMSEVDREKYPDVTQTMRFEPVEQMVAAPASGEVLKEEVQLESVEEEKNEKVQTMSAEAVRKEATKAEMEEVAEQKAIQVETAIEKEADAGVSEETISIDPLLEAYLDTDSYREKINILHGLQHRITEHMLNTMAIVIDFELPEGDIQTKYDALNDCLLTKEKYECNRMF